MVVHRHAALQAVDLQVLEQVIHQQRRGLAGQALAAQRHLGQRPADLARRGVARGREMHHVADHAAIDQVADQQPLGLLAGRSDRVERVLRPFLDIAQVLPQFVYLIPVVFLFSIGRGAGVVACVVYAVPPCIRLTAMGMREVSHAPREAAVSFGATSRQEMRLVQLPLARRSILLGINQTLLMVLATVIIAALVGAGALGLVAYEATAKPNIKLGQGVAGGVSIVLLAIMLDRITQAWGTNREGGRS